MADGRVLGGILRVLGGVAAAAALSLPAVPAQASAGPASGDLQSPGAQNFVTPTRVADTRIHLGLPGPIAPHAIVPLPVDSVVGEAAEVDAHVTVVDPAAAGHLTVFGYGLSTPPVVTDVNFARGETTSNTVVAEVTQDGRDVLALDNASSAPLQVVVDVTGFTDPGSQFVAGTFRAINPTRMLSTVTGTGGPVGRVPAHGTRTFQADATPALEGEPVPAVSAVLLNLSAVRPAAGGYLTAFAAGAARPATSTVDFAPGRTTDDFAIVPLGPTGLVSVYNGSAGAVDLTADVAGYYRSIVGVPTAAGTYQDVPAARVVDSRVHLGAADVPAHGSVRVQLGGRAGIPTARAAAAAVTLAAVAPAGAGYLTAWPAGAPRPATADLNFRAGRTAANLALVPLSGDGAIDVYNGSAHPVPVVLDVSGYFLDAVPRPLNTSTWTPLTLTPPRAAASWSSLSCVPSGFCATITDSIVDTFTPDHMLAQYKLEPRRTYSGGGHVSCGSATFCAATTTTGDAFVFTGTHWTGPLDTGLGWAPYALSCTAQQSCLALAGDGAAVLTGTTWTTVAQPPFPQEQDPDLDSVAVSCASATFCMAVDSDGLADRFDGQQWAAPTLIDAGGPYGVGPSAVSCPTTDFCMVMDLGGNMIAFRDGAWQRPYPLSSGGSAVSCTSSTFCAATAGPSEVTYSGGTTWTTNEQVDGNVLDRDPLSCISPGLCVITESFRADIGRLSSSGP